MIRTKEEARSDLQYLLCRLWRPVTSALVEYIDNYGHLRHKHHGSADASIIHSLIKWHIEQEFPRGNSDGVQTIVTKHNLFVVSIANKYLIKIKKLRGNFRTSNVQTQSVLAFIEQTSRQLNLIDPPTNLHLGYRPKNKVELLSSDIWLTCPDGNREPHWTMELQSASTTALIPVPMPQGANTERKRRVRAKAITTQGDHYKKVSDDG